MSHLALSPRRLDDDARLVAGMIADSKRAWGEFHARYGTLVWHCIRRITRRFWRVGSSVDAEDVLGTFYLSLLAHDKRKLRSFDPARGYQLSTWLRVVAMHSTYDFLRRIERDPPKEELSSAMEVPCRSPDAFGRIAGRQELSTVAGLLERFSKRDRTFARIHLFEDAAPSVVAKQMHVSVKTVYSKKNKILKRLNAALDALDGPA
jgi:RNA polymerase sigma-70 factor (ECF subfamily)